MLRGDHSGNETVACARSTLYHNYKLLLGRGSLLYVQCMHDIDDGHTFSEKISCMMVTGRCNSLSWSSPASCTSNVLYIYCISYYNFFCFCIWVAVQHRKAIFNFVGDWRVQVSFPNPLHHTPSWHVWRLQLVTSLKRCTCAVIHNFWRAFPFPAFVGAFVLFLARSEELVDHQLSSGTADVSVLHC